MSRCVICDYSQEFDSSSNKRSVKWSDKERGHVCQACSTEIYNASYQPKYANETVFGALPILDVVGPTLLEFEGVDIDQVEARQDDDG